MSSPCRKHPKRDWKTLLLQVTQYDDVLEASQKGLKDLSLPLYLSVSVSGSIPKGIESWPNTGTVSASANAELKHPKRDWKGKQRYWIITAKKREASQKGLKGCIVIKTYSKVFWIEASQKGLKVIIPKRWNRWQDDMKHPKRDWKFVGNGNMLSAIAKHPKRDWKLFN